MIADDDDTDYSPAHLRSVLADRADAWRHPTGYWINATEALLDRLQYIEERLTHGSSLEGHDLPGECWICKIKAGR